MFTDDISDIFIFELIQDNKSWEDFHGSKLLCIDKVIKFKDAGNSSLKY